MSTSDAVYARLVRRNPEAEAALPDEVARNLAPNGVRLVSGLALQSSGDQTVNASTVLPWIFHALGVPTALIGFLVPIREAGSMLPQAALTPWVVRRPRRASVFSVGAFVQAVCVAVMAAATAFTSGTVAGIVILLALAVFSLGRCLNSIASKDVLGRTVPKGERGQINGLSTTAAGIVAITLGLAIRLLGGEDLSPATLAGVLALGALAYLGSGLVYRSVREPVSEPSRSGGSAGEDRAATSVGSALASAWRTAREDGKLRRFVVVRAFLLVTSLSPPFLVALAAASGSDALSGIAGFVLASGVASLLGGRIFGRFADRSSRHLMIVAAALGSLVLLAVVAASAAGLLSDPDVAGAVLVAAFFLVTLLHTGVRVGRKTYVVDIAEGDLRTTYVAVSNSAIGVLLLVVGALTSVLAAWSTLGALILLALMGVAGVLLGLRLPDA